MITLKGQISVKRLSGRAFISKLSEVKITLEDRTVTPTAAEQVIEAGKGFDGLGVVTVKGDPNFDAKNIKTGVKIWGLEGRGVGSPFIVNCTGHIPYIHRGTARSRGLVGCGIFTSSASGAIYTETE